MTEEIEASQQQFGKFRLRRRLGAGGMAEVFLAELVGPQGFSRLLALKRILPTLSKEEEFIDAFISEARVGGSLIHPNIVPTVELGREGDYFYLAMEYVEGVTLEQLIRYRRKLGVPIPLRLAMNIMRQVADGLEYAHNATDPQGNLLRLVHRDLKPANVLLGRHGVVRLTDFGVAKAESNLNRTTTGIVKGTVAYMSPEQAKGENLDRRSDLYSFGAILFEVLTSEKLYPNARELAGLQRVANGDIRDRMPLLSSCPPQVVAMVERALAVNPDDRYATARELSLELEAVAAQAPPAPDLATLVREAMEDEARQAQPRNWSAAFGPDGSGQLPPGVPTMPKPSGLDEATRPNQFAFEGAGGVDFATGVVVFEEDSGPSMAGARSSGPKARPTVGPGSTEAASGAASPAGMQTAALDRAASSQKAVLGPEAPGPTAASSGSQHGAGSASRAVVPSEPGAQLPWTTGDSGLLPAQQAEAARGSRRWIAIPVVGVAVALTAALFWSSSQRDSGASDVTGARPESSSIVQAPATSSQAQPGGQPIGDAVKLDGSSMTPGIALATRSPAPMAPAAPAPGSAPADSASAGIGAANPAAGPATNGATGPAAGPAANGANGSVAGPTGATTTGTTDPHSRDVKPTVNRAQPPRDAKTGAVATRDRTAAAGCPQILNPPKANAGYLSINAVPYAYVYVDGCRVADTTPLVELALLPGSRKISLKTTDGRTKAVDHPVVIKKGEVTKEATVKF